MRIDGEAGVFAREASLRFREAEFVAHKVQAVCCIGAVENRERRIEPNTVSVLTQQSISNRMKGAGPRDLPECRGASGVLGGACFGQDTLSPPRHLSGSAAGKSQQQDPLRRRPHQNRMGDTVGQRIRFSGASPGDDQERARICAGGNAIFNRRPLCVVQIAEVSCDIHDRPRRVVFQFCCNTIARRMPVSEPGSFGCSRTISLCRRCFGWSFSGLS